MSISDYFTACVWFNPDYQRNTFASMLAGILFFSGWWFLIDALAVYPGAISGTYVILGVLGTISLFMINSVTQAQINGDSTYSGGCLEGRGARVWIFVGFVIGFAAIIAAIWVMIVNFTNKTDQISSYPGVCLLLQNILIFVSSIVYKFGRTEDLYA